jgi:hypothetical protein
MLGGHATFISGFFQLLKNKSCRNFKILKEKDYLYVTWKKNIMELEVFFFTSQQIDDNCVNL